MLVKALAGWLTTFFMVVFVPTKKTFITESKKAAGSFGSAVFWVATSTFLSLLFLNYSQNVGFSASIIVVSVILMPIFLLIFVFLLNRLSGRLFRKKDHYEEIPYFVASIFVSTNFFSILLALIPSIGGTISLLVEIYGLLLIVLILRSIVKLKYWQAIVVLVPSIIVAYLIFFCSSIFFVSLIQTVPNLMR